MTESLISSNKANFSLSNCIIKSMLIIGIGIGTATTAQAETKKMSAASTPSAATLRQGSFSFGLGYNGSIEAGARAKNKPIQLLQTSETGVSFRYGLLNSSEINLGLFQDQENWKIKATQKNTQVKKNSVAAKIKQRLYQDHRQILSLELYGDKVISHSSNTYEDDRTLSAKPGYDSPTLGASILYSAGKLGLGEIRINLGMLNNFEKPTYSDAIIKRETFQEATLISYLSPSSSLFVSGGWNWYEIEAPSETSGNDLQWTKQNYKVGVSGFVKGAALSFYLGQENHIGGPREGRRTSLGASLSFTMQKMKKNRVKRPETVQEALANHKGGIIEDFDMTKIDSPITDEKDDFYLYDLENRGKDNQKAAQEFMILEKELERLKVEQELAAQELRASEEKELQRQREEIMDYLMERKELLEEYSPKYEKELDEEYEFKDEIQNWRLY